MYSRIDNGSQLSDVVFMVETLDNLRQGHRGTVVSLSDDQGCGCCLRRYGLREGITVEVVSNSDPVMIRFDGCCLALRRCMLKGVRCRCRGRNL